MSTSDDKLDALYKLSLDTPEDRSPEDINSLIRANARDALSAPEQWRKRYGWASAATVFLTTALFFSVNNAPEPANNVADTFQQPVQQPVQRSASEADDMLVPPAALEAAPATAPVPSHTRKKLGRSQMSVQKISTESMSGLSALSKPAPCRHYPNLLVTQVCVEKQASTADASTDLVLKAHPQSSCAGETLKLPRPAQPFVAHKGSSMERFVLAKSVAELSVPAEQEIVCKKGQLVIQSLARGR